MDFSEALISMRLGKTIRRQEYTDCEFRLFTKKEYAYIGDTDMLFSEDKHYELQFRIIDDEDFRLMVYEDRFEIEDLLATDWEIVE